MCFGVVTICGLLLAGCTSGTTTAASPSATPSALPSPSSPSPTPTPTPTEEPKPPVKEARLEGTFVAQGFVTQLKFEPKCKKGPCDVAVEAVVQLDKGDTQKTEGDLELKGMTYKGTLAIEWTCDFQGGPTFHPPADLELEVTARRGDFVRHAWRVSVAKVKAKVRAERFVSTSSTTFSTTTYTCDGFSFGNSFLALAK
jgi:hypothetical protein